MKLPENNLEAFPNKAGRFGQSVTQPNKNTYLYQFVSSLIPRKTEWMHYHHYSNHSDYTDKDQGHLYVPTVDLMELSSDGIHGFQRKGLSASVTAHCQGIQRFSAAAVLSWSRVQVAFC